MYDEVDRLHVKRNMVVGMNYLGIIDYKARPGVFIPDN